LEKVLSIIRNRLAEVLMVVGFHAASLILMEQLLLLCLGEVESVRSGSVSNVPEVVVLGLSTGAMAFSVIWMMLFAGFLATASHYSDTPAQPAELLRAGKVFFWRMFRFQFFFSLVYMMLSSMIFAVVGTVTGRKDMPEWMMHLCSLVAVAALAKVVLLTPAIIIVRNCRVREALGLLKEYKLLEDGAWMIWLFLGCFFAVFLVSLVVDIDPDGGLGMAVFRSIVTGVVTLVVGLGAVQIVAAKEPDSEIEKESLE
jgi:hypothetical protein